MSEQPNSGDGLPVNRNGNMPRFTIDTALFTFLGRDIEGALLAFSSDITRLGGESGQMADITAEANVLEVARIRMAPETAALIIRNLYMLMLSNDLTTPEQLRDDLASIEQQVALMKGEHSVQ